MKATIKKIEELNQMAIDLENTNKEAHDLLTKAIDANIAFKHSVEGKEWNEWTDEDKKLLEKSNEAYEAHEAIQKTYNRNERKFIRSVKSLAESLGLKVSKPAWDKSKIDFYDCTKILDDIYYRMRDTLRHFYNYTDYSGMISTGAEFEINYEEVRF